MSIMTEPTNKDRFFVLCLATICLFVSYLLGRNAVVISDAITANIYTETIIGVIAYSNLALLTIPAFGAAHFFQLFVLNSGGVNDCRWTSDMVTFFLWYFGAVLLLWPVMLLVAVLWYKCLPSDERNKRG